MALLKKKTAPITSHDKLAEAHAALATAATAASHAGDLAHGEAEGAHQSALYFAQAAADATVRKEEAVVVAQLANTFNTVT